MVSHVDIQIIDIPGVNKSPSKILNGQKFMTNLPMIDVHQKPSKSEIENLAMKRMSKSAKGQELSKLPVGTPILYDLNLDSTKVKHSLFSQYFIFCVLYDHHDHAMHHSTAMD